MSSGAGLRLEGLYSGYIKALASLECSRPTACPNSWLATPKNEMAVSPCGAPIVHGSSESKVISPAHGLDGGHVSPSTFNGPSIDSNEMRRSDWEAADTSWKVSGVT